MLPVGFLPTQTKVSVIRDRFYCEEELKLDGSVCFQNVSFEGCVLDFKNFPDGEINIFRNCFGVGNTLHLYDHKIDITGFECFEFKILNWTPGLSVTESVRGVITS